MKQLSLAKWILLGSAIAVASACNCQRKEEMPKKREMHKENEEREDGDMCSLEGTEEETSKEAFSPEVKAEPPVPPVPASKSARQVSENRTAPVQKAESAPSSEKSAAV